MSQEQAWATRCLHSNPQHDQFGAVVPPLYQTSTFEFKNCEQGGNRFAGKEDGYMYTRLGNPTIANLEGKIASLEGAEAAACTSSGMGAIASTVWTFLSAGDHMISDDTLYGCTVSLFSHHLRRMGIEVDLIDTSIPGEVQKHLKKNTKIVYCETPANPTLKCVDLERVSKEAHSQPGVLVVCDNTFCTALIQRPLAHGVDIVVNSMTKFYNGHTDVVAGIICGKKEHINKIKAEGIKDITGSVMSPHDAWLVVRGMSTLALRIQRCSENAEKIAHFLKDHPKVSHVYYPGLKDHPTHDIACKQMDGFGAMITFELKGGHDAGVALLDHVKLMTLAVSLGGCESLIQHPASMTHACVPKEEREAAGITDGMIRLSVGIEGVDDLIADLKQALDFVK